MRRAGERARDRRFVRPGGRPSFREREQRSGRALQRDRIDQRSLGVVVLVLAVVPREVPPTASSPSLDRSSWGGVVGTPAGRAPRMTRGGAPRPVPTRSIFALQFVLCDRTPNGDVLGVECEPMPQPRVMNTGHVHQLCDVKPITRQIAHTTRLMSRYAKREP